MKIYFNFFLLLISFLYIALLNDQMFGKILDLVTGKVFVLLRALCFNKKNHDSPTVYILRRH